MEMFPLTELVREGGRSSCRGVVRCVACMENGSSESFCCWICVHALDVVSNTKRKTNPKIIFRF